MVVERRYEGSGRKVGLRRAKSGRGK